MLDETAKPDARVTAGVAGDDWLIDWLDRVLRRIGNISAM